MYLKQHLGVAMPIIKIRFNIKHKVAWIDNRKKICKQHRDLFVDVFEHCFKCELFLGLIFSKTGIKIICGENKKQRYLKIIRYVPKDFKSLLKLQHKIIKSKNKEKIVKKLAKRYGRYNKWKNSKKPITISY